MVNLSVINPMGVIVNIIKPMIVPQFKLKQTEICVQIFIRLPYVKVSSCEFHIEAGQFKFYLKPYLLSLSFEQLLKEAEEPVKAVYYHDKYVLEVHVEKKQCGEEFKNLELIAGLLNRKKEKKKQSGRTLVQVVGDGGNYGVVLEEGDKGVVNAEYQYGFGLNYHNVFANLQEEEAELFSFSPKSTPYGQRLALSGSIIAKEFDMESYLFDKYENEEEISAVIKGREYDAYLLSIESAREGVDLNYQDFRTKLKLTSKQLLVSLTKRGNIAKEIASIMFSYLYQLICMCGDFGTESARTINKTAMVLSCNYLYYGESVREMLVDCCRRCLTYSLYKNLEICRVVLRYLADYLTAERVRLVLEDVKKMMDRSEPRYLLNRIYIEDYLVYVYSGAYEEEWAQLSKQVREVVVEEGDLGLGIMEYQLGGEESGEEKEQAEVRQLVCEMQDMETMD